MSETDVKVVETLGECGVLPSAAQKVQRGGGLEPCLEMNCGTPVLDKLGTALWEKPGERPA